MVRFSSKLRFARATAKIVSVLSATFFSRRPSATQLAELVIERDREGDEEGVLRTALEMVRLHPQEASGFFWASRSLINLGRLDEALQLAEQGLRIHPERDALQSIKFSLHIKMGHSEEIARYAASLLNPGTQDVPHGLLLDLAGYEMARLNFAGAERAVRRVLAETNARVSAYFALATSLLARNRPNEAMNVLLEAMEVHPDESKAYALAELVQTQMGNTDGVLKYARKRVALEPACEKAHYSVYLSLVSLGRFAEAEQQLSLARRSSPRFDASKYSHQFRQIERMRDQVPAVVEAWESGLRNRGALPNVKANAKAVPVIQYWSQGEPPNDLKLVVATWNAVLREIGLGPTLIYNKERAGRWITDNAPEFCKAFAQAFHFAMEADIFRIAFASRSDCIYIDIDSWPIAGVEQILSRSLHSGSSILYFRAGQPWLNNNFFVARRNCPFFSELVRQCSAIDASGLPQDRGTILSTFGPERYNAVLYETVSANPVEDVQQVPGASGVSAIRFRDGRSLLFVNEFSAAAQKPPFPLTYASTADHWKTVPRRAKSMI
jgi:tetratricopeptide (TPR) repeat protein